MLSTLPHGIMILVGNTFAIFNLRDMEEKPGRSARGRWRDPVLAQSTSDDKELSITSSAKEHLKWWWTADAPSVLRIGVESDQSKSSHQQGAKVWLQDLVILEGVSRDDLGHFAVAGGGEGSGRLVYKNRLFEAGPINWTVIRYAPEIF